MRNVLLALLILGGSFSAQAVSLKVFDACHDEPVHSGQYTADLNRSVGELSVEIFNHYAIPYIGAAEGFNSILNSPIGLDSIEVVSDVEMRVYGWCYSVNGEQPDSMAHKIFLTHPTDEIVWFYAYSTNLYNEWTNYCRPANEIKAEQFCSKP